MGVLTQLWSLFLGRHITTPVRFVQRPVSAVTMTKLVNKNEFQTFYKL
jgi:hypothetical protein